jgi:hypothetical protein
MNTNIRYILGGIVSCSLFLNGVGCSTSQNVSLLAPEKRDFLVDSSQTVVAGTITDSGFTADLTLGEQLQLGMPSKPKNGYKKDFTIKIDHVVKGVYSSSILKLHDLQDPEQTGLTNPRLWLGLKQKVYVGWRSKNDGSFDGLMIVNVQKVYFLDATTIP